MTAVHVEPQYAALPDGTPMQRLADIVRVRARATPDLPAVLEPSGITTFAELDRRSSQVARALLADGVVGGDRVVYIGSNSAAYLEVIYGAAKMGAIATPLNNRLAPVEITRIIDDAAPAVVVLGGAETGLAEAIDGPRIITAAGLDAWRDAADDSDPGHQATLDEAALIFYTSGTTGAPKGVVLTGGNVAQALDPLHRLFELDPTAVAMAPVPFFHVAGFGLALVATLNGAALLLEMTADPAALIDLLVDRRVSHAVLVPTLIQWMINAPAAQSADWSALRYVVYGAAPMPVPVIEAATRILGCKFIQSYGLTESTGGVTALWAEDHLPPPGREHQLRSVGKALPNVRLRIVDPVTLQDLPTGTRGEVLIGGGHVMSGYWGRPDADAEALTPDGWLRTGDGGSLDEEGFLYLHDRLKDMIVTGAENVYPAEVESVLSGHPDLAEVAVVGVPSEKWGESPFAVVVAKPDTAPDPDEILAWARERLAHFKVPVGVEFVDVLPRTASGKIVKHHLRESLSGVSIP